MSRVGRLLNSSVTVWRSSTVPDGGGGQESTWVLVATVRARLSQPSARDREASAQASAELSQTVYLAPSADVRRGDRLHTGGGQVLDVVATLAPSVPGTYLRADCSAREPVTGGP